MNRLLTWIFSLAVLLGASQLAGCATVNALHNSGLIPRSELFAPQNTFFYRLNSSGTKLAYLDATLPRQILVRDVACLSCNAAPAAIDLPDGARPFMFFWAKQENRMVIVYSSPSKKRLDVANYDLVSKQFTSMFPEENVTSFLSDAGANSFYAVPQSIFKISAKGQEDRFFKVDFENGERISLNVQGQVLQIEPIGNGMIGINTASKPGTQEWVYTQPTGTTLPLLTFQAEDRKHFSGFLTSYYDPKKRAHALFLDTTSTDTLVISDIDLQTGEKTIVAQDKADIRNVFIQPHIGLQAYVRNFKQPEWIVNDSTLDTDFAFLSKGDSFLSGVWSRSKDDQRWLVTHLTSRGQEEVSIYDRPSRKLTRVNQTGNSLIAHSPALQVRSAVVVSRDNTPLVSYLTTPANKACLQNNCPMVVYIHGGPHARDEYPRSPVIAWLVNRGYAVLTVNYRGSSGFGKSFESMSKGQWGLAMQDDVLDAVDWAIQTKVADPQKIAVMGASHGGFLAANSITVAPDRFACAVASAATGDLASFVEKVVATQPWLATDLYESVGDTRISEVKTALKARSPISKIAEVKAPILITHGGKDQQSPLSDAEAYAAALHAGGKKVAFAVFPEEGHGVNSPDTKLVYYGIIENFLAACLGGKSEPGALTIDKSKIDIRLGQNLYPFLTRPE